MGWFDKLIGGQKGGSAPKQEHKSSLPQGFQWADRINKLERGYGTEDERWRIWREAKESGIHLRVNENMWEPGEPDFYPEGALSDYQLHRGILRALCPKCGASYVVDAGPWCDCQ